MKEQCTYELYEQTIADISLLRGLAGYDFCTEGDIISYAVELLKDRCREGIIRAQELNAV